MPSLPYYRNSSPSYAGLYPVHSSNVKINKREEGVWALIHTPLLFQQNQQTRLIFTKFGRWSFSQFRIILDIESNAFKDSLWELASVIISRTLLSVATSHFAGFLLPAHSRNRASSPNYYYQGWGNEISTTPDSAHFQIIEIIRQIVRYFAWRLHFYELF